MSTEESEFINFEFDKDSLLTEEIEHLLIMVLHPLNNIAEIERAKHVIYELMRDTSCRGISREC